MAAAATAVDGGGGAAAQQRQQQQQQQQQRAAAAAARALYEQAWSRGDIRLLDAIMAPDHVQNDAIWQPERAGQENIAAPGNPASGPEGRRAATAGRDRMKRGILAYRRAYPDVTFQVLDCAVATPAEGPQEPISHSSSPPLWRVFVHWRARGTNTGPIGEAPPTGRRVEFSGVTVATVRVDGSGSSAQLLRSDVYRQAPADEAAYFLSKGAVVGVGVGVGGGGGGGAGGGGRGGS